ncbi:hypothetical protein [Deinococcus rubellus]|uniref:hypothetical protein n=1 Tax=Deinococcus rubellus TaxID=1889240 RepID=UPI0031F0BAA9
MLAEDIVAQALGGIAKPRAEWDAYELKIGTGLKIEVKSSAYLQTWEQKRHSTIRFDIGMKKGWDAETNVSALERARAADVYIFCVFATQERAAADPLELSQWFFMVCSTRRLSQQFNTQKTVGLAALEALGLERLRFEDLRVAVAREESGASEDHFRNC